MTACPSVTPPSDNVEQLDNQRYTAGDIRLLADTIRPVAT